MKSGANAPCHSSKVQTHRTPTPFVNYWEERFGTFHLDAAASAKNAVCKVYITEKEDALKTCWLEKLGSKGWQVFLNPPYNQIYDFLSRVCHFVDRRVSLRVVALLPVRAGADWWHEFVPKASEVHFLRGRIRFVGSKTGAPFDSCVIVWERLHGSSNPAYFYKTLPKEVMGWIPKRKKRKHGKDTIRGKERSKKSSKRSTGPSKKEKAHNKRGNRQS